MKFAEILTKLMENAQITNYKLEQETGISNSLISSWKRGKCEPGSKNMQILANYFGVSVNYLLGIEQTKQEILDIIDNDINRARDERETTLLTQFRKLDELGKMRVIQALMDEVDKL